MNGFTWPLIAVLFAGQAAMAQTAPLVAVKTGDKLVYELIQYDMRGTELYAASTTVVAADVEVSPDGRVLSYSNGRVEKYDAAHTLIERTVGDRLEKVAEDRLFKWMPDGKDFKSTRQVKHSFQARRSCGGGSGTTEYEASSRERTYTLTVAGKETEVAAIEILLDGRWSAGTCGSGKQVRKVIYAPALDAVLHYQNLGYRPNGVFLDTGSGWFLKSIN